MLPGDLFCGAKEESFEGFLEVLVEGDVDDRVDHGVRVGKHVDPEGVSEKKKKYCDYKWKSHLHNTFPTTWWVETKNCDDNWKVIYHLFS